MTYSVSEVNLMAAELFATHPAFNKINVFGEISGGKLYPSGHFYFTLKDENSTISCVMFRFAYNKIGFKPENGAKVSLVANASIYEKTGRFQLVVQSMEPQGIGDLHKQFEQLKKDLADKGYFDQQRKKPIPYLPKIIGVATSSSGAVIQDMINILRRRFPGFNMQLISVAVQGEGAAKQIADAINTFNARNEVDVIVIARGGGSIEDLWAFNEKTVADAIVDSKIPIISAVGHETDFTISDFTADLRAPTPSAAAELLFPEKEMLYSNIKQAQERLKLVLNRQLSECRNMLDNLKNRPVFTRPNQIIDQKRLLIDDLHNRIFREFKHQTFAQKQAIIDVKSKLNMQIKSSYNNKEQTLINIKTKLEALNPFSVLERGYAYIENEQGEIVNSVHKVSIGQNLKIHWNDGSAESKIINLKTQKVNGNKDD